MTGSVILDVIIGLVFIYLLYSLLATILQEFIATKLAFRSKILEKAIVRMLEDGKSTSKFRILDRVRGFVHLLGKPNILKNKKIASWFYAHPLIKYLGEDNFFSKPAYLSSQNFSKVIIDLLHGIDGGENLNILKIKNSLENHTINTFPIDTVDEKNNPAIEALGLMDTKGATAVMNNDTAIFLKSLWRDSGGDVNKFKLKLEQWFDDTMERATGWYKRYTKVILFTVGLLIAIGFNIDTVSIVKKLARDPKLREQLIQSANGFMQENQALGIKLQEMHDRKLDSTPMYSSVKANYDSLTQRSSELMDSAKSMINKDIKNVNELVGMGWDKGFFCFEGSGTSAGKAMIGFLLTAFAISLGAPFWYDMLSKLMKIRGAGANSAGSPTGGTTPNSGASPQANSPVNFNVNTNQGEEAVG